MKYLLISLIFLCSLSILSVYIFLPATINFSKVAIIKTKLNIANRFLLDESRWNQWFPSSSENTHSDSSLNKYNRYAYSIEKKTMNAAAISISNNEVSQHSVLNIISINRDSIAIEWKSEMPKVSNPIGRVRNYIAARKLQNDMGNILDSLKKFLARDVNVYGIHLYETMSRDSALVATQFVTKLYPSTNEIYNAIALLKKYIISNEAKENNYPMLHVKEINDTTFETMVAIPINKYLAGNNKIFLKRFVPWKVLAAEVRGGNNTVKEAFQQMATYISDYGKTAMAMPFASLVTDRSLEQDTLKWVTRIYTPVP